MASNAYTLRGIWTAALTGLCLIALACGFQAAFSPTVRVSCPARTAVAPDCDLRWLVAFDLVTIRHTPLPALQSVSEIEQTARPRRGGTTTLYLNTAAGRVRTILWGGDHVELQGLRDPLRAYLADAHAPPLDVTIWPSRAPVRMIANVVVCVGLLFWIWLPVQVAVVVARRVRSDSGAADRRRKELQLPR
jgi:hypothetical protein